MSFEKVLQVEQKIEMPLAKVFEFFSRAENLQRITPPLLDFKIVSKTPIEMKPGALIDYKLQVHGVPLRWRTLIEEWDPPHKFVDTQLRGPYSLWHHTHEFIELTPNLTLIKDTVRYRLPFGYLGLLVHKLMVQKDIQKIFAFRQSEVPKLLQENA